MYHYDRHYSDAVHEDDDFRNRLCFSPVEDLGGWRKIMSIGFAGSEPLHCSTIHGLYQSEARLYMFMSLAYFNPLIRDCVAKVTKV